MAPLSKSWLNPAAAWAQVGSHVDALARQLPAGRDDLRLLHSDGAAAGLPDHAEHVPDPGSAA